MVRPTYLDSLGVIDPADVSEILMPVQGAHFFLEGEDPDLNIALRNWQGGTLITPKGNPAVGPTGLYYKGDEVGPPASGTSYDTKVVDTLDFTWMFAHVADAITAEYPFGGTIAGADRNNTGWLIYDAWDAANNRAISTIKSTGFTSVRIVSRVGVPKIVCARVDHLTKMDYKDHTNNFTVTSPLTGTRVAATDTVRLGGGGGRNFVNSGSIWRAVGFPFALSDAERELMYQWMREDVLTMHPEISNI